MDAALSTSHENAIDITPQDIIRDTTPLRFITCGSVDDGKSTLIGRLLWDTKAVFEDQLEAAGSNNNDELKLPDFANLLDGLQAEREQGITIDVAYRYFSTAKRSFIVADTPGHQQYTRNMATGASTADLAVLLVDARTGILEQTRRHATIASLMGITQLILVINKIDLVDYSQSHFDQAVEAFEDFAKSLNISSITAIPTSAIKGENVASTAVQKMPWYTGSTLLDALEYAAKRAPRVTGFRLPVQRVSRPNESFRGYQGTVAGGSIKPGDAVVILPSGEPANISKIVTFDLIRNAGVTGDAVTLVLDRQVDVSRGDMIITGDAKPHVAKAFEAHLIVLTDQGITIGKRYRLKSNNRKQYVLVTPDKVLDLQSGSWDKSEDLSLNNIAKIRLDFEALMVFDSYEDNKDTGSFILIDPDTNNTVAGGMILNVASSVVPLIQPDQQNVTILGLPTALADEFKQSEFFKNNAPFIQTSDIPIQEATKLFSDLGRQNDQTSNEES